MLKWLRGLEAKLTSEARRLFTTFAFLAAKQGATAGIGIIYWVVATHFFDAEEVGLAAAAGSTAMLLAAFSALGVPLLLLAEIEGMDPTERRSVFTTGINIAAVVVLIASLVTMSLSHWLGTSLRIIGGDRVTATLFVVGSLATLGGLTFDAAAIGLHRGAAQLWRGSLGSVLKLVCVAFLIVASVRTSAGLIFAWAVALVAAFFICMPMLGLTRTPAGEGSLGHRAALVRRYWKLSLQHNVLNLSISSVSFIIPLIAVLLISPEQVAYFSAAYLLSATMLSIQYMLALSLFAERSGDPELLSRNVKRTLPLAITLVLAIVVVVEIAAPFALRIFGPAYAANGTTALRILILVGPAYVVKDHYVSIRRAQHRMSHGAAIMAIGTTAEVVGSAVGGVLWGVTGICVGWVVIATCEALFLLPAVLQVYRHVPVSTPIEDQESDSAGTGHLGQGDPATWIDQDSGYPVVQQVDDSASGLRAD
jgi:O-antigen/teichoic acid export membrane protein